MPTITFSKKDFEALVGKRFSEKELERFLTFAKGELDDLSGDEVTVGLDDTNQPALWSVEGLARLAKGIYGIEKGIPKINVSKSDFKVVVDKGVKKVRPYIACFVAKGKKLTDDFLKQLIQLQEKLAEGFGRKRKKLSIGVYPSKKISFPINYKAVSGDVSFVPLDFKTEFTIREILKEHPKGKEYAWILEKFDKYPVLVDSKNQILSLAPIINSETMGKLEVGDDELFFDCTGSDKRAVELAADIFAQALFDRGFKLFYCEIDYPDEKIVTPVLDKLSVSVKQRDFEDLIGEKMSSAKIRDCLRRMRCDYKDGSVIFPCYRADVMHKVDAIEECAIGFGFDVLEPLPLDAYTKGSPLPKIKIIDAARELMVGLGFQEVFSMMLSNKDLLYDKMGVQDLGTIEIATYLSEKYSVVRTWLLPILFDMLSHNKHYDYPQKVFEQGLATLKVGDSVVDEEHLAGISAHPKANFTEAKQAVEYLLSMLGVDFKIEEFDHSSFISGRCAKVICRNKMIGFLGEIHPKVLENFGLLVPVCAFELSLDLVIKEKNEAESA